MWKKLVVGTAMLAVLGAWGAGSAYVSAQTAPERPGGQFSPADLGAFLEARIAALHAGLQLTPEQERLWPPFEQAFRERGKLRLARAAAAAPPEPDPIARLQRRADAMLQQGAALKRLADAAAPLWQSFDEGQKRRYAVLTLPFRGRMMTRPGGDRGDERSGPGRDGGGFGRDGGPGGFGQRGFGPQGFGSQGYGPQGSGPRGFGPPSAWHGPRLRPRSRPQSRLWSRRGAADAIRWTGGPRWRGFRLRSRTAWT
jgi:hypothetical protein